MKQKAETGFGAKLKQLREARGLTQSQLADTAGMNRFGLAKLEQGVTEPYWPTVLKLAAALGVACTEFVDVMPARIETPAPESPTVRRVGKKK